MKRFKLEMQEEQTDSRPSTQDTEVVRADAIEVGDTVVRVVGLSSPFAGVVRRSAPSTDPWAPNAWTLEIELGHSVTSYLDEWFRVERVRPNKTFTEAFGPRPY